MKISNTCLWCAMLLLLSNCKDEKITQVPIKGSLYGFVHNGYSGSLSGVKVLVEGTDPAITVLSGSDGKYEVTDLSMGTYNFIFEKPGYGTYKIMGYSFLGGNVPNHAPLVTIYPLPELKIKDIQASINTWGNYSYLEGQILIDVSTDAPVSSPYFRYYINTTPDVTPSNYVESDILDSYGNLSSNFFSLNLNPKKYPSGTTIYFKVYPCSDTFSGYIDINTGKTIYSSIAQTGFTVMSFKIP